VSQNSINLPEIELADYIVLHNIVDTDGLAEILARRELSNYTKKIIVDVDDALFVREDNPHAKKWEVLDASFIISQTIKQADLVTTTNIHLAGKLRELNRNTVLLPNYYHPIWFDVSPIENISKDIRIVWAGSMTHYKDLEMIVNPLNWIMAKYENVRLVVCGDFRIKELLFFKDRVEVNAPVPIEVWPSKLASMAGDIGIAPLIDDEFNRSKSYIKAIEYGLVKMPVVASSIVYEGHTPFLCRSDEDWMRHLDVLVKDKHLRKKEGVKAYEHALKYNMEHHYKEWMNTYLGA